MLVSRSLSALNEIQMEKNKGVIEYLFCFENNVCITRGGSKDNI